MPHLLIKSHPVCGGEGLTVRRAEFLASPEPCADCFGEGVRLGYLSPAQWCQHPSTRGRRSF